MRTINADEALRMIRNSKQDCPYHRNSYEATAWREAHDCAISCVEAAPTIAEPVKHGRWETVPYREFDGFETVVNGTAERCTNCCRASKDFKKWFDYCPNCGAKMDGGNVE